MAIINDKNIADDRQNELVLKGIQPRHQFAFRLFKICRATAIGMFIFAAILFGLTFIDATTKYTGTSIYRHVILYDLYGVAGFLILAVLIKLLFLRRPPMDDWVFDIAQKRLGTEVIFYDSKRLYIEYDRAGKEVDKKDFVVEMSDKSDNYTYFYLKTLIDKGIIIVECTKRQPIPTSALFNADDDIYWNIFPLGLTRNEVNKTISPIGWYLNDNNVDDRMVASVPSTSILVCGGTGSGKSVLEQSM